MVAIREKDWPAVRNFYFAQQFIRKRGLICAVSVDLPQRPTGGWRINNNAAATPRRPAAESSICNDLGRALSDGHFLQLPTGEEPHEGVVGRPKRIGRTFCPRQQAHLL